MLAGGSKAADGETSDVVAVVAAADHHRRCHAPCGSNSVADICSNCVQLCGRCSYDARKQ